MKLNCETCGRKFEAKRKHQKFCSAKCRLINHEEKERTLVCPHCDTGIKVSIKKVREL